MSPKSLVYTLLVTFAFALTACGKNSEQKSGTYSYDFTENGCATGSHTFGSKSEYCSGLRNDQLNNYCASTLRQSALNQECSATGLTAEDEPGL